ncbi:hypothetical protein U1Q18_024882 [Sarracenia purpurea var. burkii]
MDLGSTARKQIQVVKNRWIKRASIRHVGGRGGVRQRRARDEDSGEGSRSTTHTRRASHAEEDEEALRDLVRELEKKIGGQRTKN